MPGSRSVVGGLLVAVAALGTWSVAAGTGDAPAHRYLVASRALGPGERIGLDDVSAVAADLPRPLEAGAFDDPEAVVGSVLLGPLAPGELLQAANLEPAAGSGADREVSFSVAAEWAVAGTLRPGDRIDVFATTGDGASASTERVLRAATVRRVDRGGGDGLGESQDQTLTVGVEDPAAVAATINATRSGTVTVVRVTSAGAEPAPPATTTTAPRTTTTRRGGR